MVPEVYNRETYRADKFVGISMIVLSVFWAIFLVVAVALMNSMFSMMLLPIQDEHIAYAPTVEDSVTVGSTEGGGINIEDSGEPEVAEPAGQGQMEPGEVPTEGDIAEEAPGESAEAEDLADNAPPIDIDTMQEPIIDMMHYSLVIATILILLSSGLYIGAGIGIMQSRMWGFALGIFAAGLGLLGRGLIGVLDIALIVYCILRLTASLGPKPS